MTSPLPPALEGLDLRATLRALKAAHGWSNDQLAEAAGCGRTNISSYLGGHISMSLAKMEAMLAALGYKLIIVKADERSR